LLWFFCFYIFAKNTPTMVRILIVFFLLILFNSCKNNTQISEHFVSQYNELANNSKNSIIYNTYSRLYSEKIPKEYEIDIIIELSIKKNEYKKPLGLNILTKNIVNLLLDSDLKDLIGSGGKINLKYKTFDNYFVEEFLLDLKKIDEISKLNEFETPKNLNLNQAELVRNLKRINSYLPYSNYEDRTELLKFELDKWNNINCHVRFDGDFSAFSVYYFHKRMENNKYISSIIKNKEKYELISITYIFQDSEGEFLGDYMVKP